jgi:NADH-quinone oxidoreductase subunit N
MPQLNFNVILPLIVLCVWACALLLVDLFLKNKGVTALLAALGLALTLGLTLSQIGYSATNFNTNGVADVVVDGFSTFVNALLLVSGLLSVAVAYDYLKRTGIERGEYYSLMLFSIAGMMLMAQASNLVVVFLALELLSIPLYVLAAFARPRIESEEAGLKYFLLGAFSGGFVVYGIALVFGATGSTSLQGIVTAAASGANALLLSVGAALILVGIAFKVAAVPFHMWTPDVYHGAPSAVTAFMASGAKIAGFSALLRVFVLAFPTVSADLTPILAVIAALTMIVGNLLAISQTNIKRLLAYSSIAHAGYILMAFVPYGQAGVVATSVASGLFYLVSYAISNFGAWAVVIALEGKEGKGLEISNYAGLGRKHPALAAAMAIFMLSLTGIPPTLGFVGKFYLFRAAIEGQFYLLAVIGVVTSLLSAYYYLRVVVTMYMRDGEPETTSEPWLNLTWSVSAILTVLVSLFPAPLFSWATSAVFRLF